MDDKMMELKTRPAEVNRAILLWALTMAIGVLKAIIDWRHLVTVGGGVVSTATTLIFTFAFTAFFLWKIAQGRNWARITFLVLFIIGTVPYVFILRTEYPRSTFLASVALVQVAIQLYAMLLLFASSGRTWFGQR